MWNDGKFIRIFGHGTLSGDFIPHPKYADPPVRFVSWKYGWLKRTVTKLVKIWFIQLIPIICVLPLLSRWRTRTSSHSTRSTLWGRSTLGSDFFLCSAIMKSCLFQVEGITIANSAFHSLMLINSYQPEDPTCNLDFSKNFSININIVFIFANTPLHTQISDGWKSLLGEQMGTESTLLGTPWLKIASSGDQE